MTGDIARLVTALGTECKSGKSLASDLGVRERDVRRFVLAARKAGNRIVANERGYRLVSDAGEAELAAKTIMRHGACEMATGRMYLRWARELRSRVPDFPVQQSFGF